MFFPYPISRVRAARRACVPALAMLMLLTRFAHATEQALTLDATVRQAVAQAPLLQAQRYRWASAREETGRAGALPDPQLTVGIDNLSTQGPGAYTAGGDSMTMRSVGFSQILPSRDKRRAERDLANANADVAASAVQATALILQQRVAQTWIAAWGATAEQRMLRQLHDEWTLDLTTAQARLRGGDGTAGDVLALRTQMLELDNRLDDAQAREAQARASLRRWVGAQAERPLADAPDFSHVIHDEQALLARVDDQGELLGWSAREQAAQAALDEAQAARHPEWSLGASYGARTRGLSNMLTVQVGVSLPLFTRNRQDRGISARAADLDAVRAEHDDARRQQIAAVQSAWAQWQALGQQVRRHREQLLPLAHDRAMLALAAYRGGAELQPLLEARRDELAHHLDYVRMLADYGQAWAALTYLISEDSTP